MRSGQYKRDEEILAFKDVSAGYGETAVLRSVSFSISRGEIAGVVSMDAVGKSSLVKVAAGLLEPFEGKVEYRGHDIYAMSFGQDQVFRKRTAVVLEGGALLANRSVLDNVGLPLRYHDGVGGDEAEVTVRDWLSRVGYTEDPTSFPWQVSMRGRRLASFARALVREPELVIVDRFFEGLDATDWKRLMELVINLNVELGTTFLIVGRLAPTIFHLAERVLVLQRGTVEAFAHKQTLMKVDHIRRAFETGDESISGERELTGTQKVILTDSEPFTAKSDSDIEPVVVVQDDMSASASDRLEPQSSSDDGGGETTMTLPPSAARKLLDDARRRADARIEEDARKTESGSGRHETEKGGRN